VIEAAIKRKDARVLSAASEDTADRGSAPAPSRTVTDLLETELR
jgi:hypothetical protein